MRFVIARLAALLLTGCVAALIPASAAAQAPPACPDTEDLLSLGAPTFSTHGASDVFRVSNADEYGDTEQFANVRLTISPELGQSTSTEVELGPYGNGKLILVAPAQGAFYVATLDWDQNLGRQSACHGTDAYRVALVEPGAKLGDAEYPSLAGKFAVEYSPLNHDGPGATSRWTLDPYCEYFACNTLVESSVSLRGIFKLRSNGLYRHDKLYKRRGGSCRVTVTRRDYWGDVVSRHTFVVKPAYRYRRTILLRVTDQENGQVTAFKGTRKTTAVPIGRARLRGCMIEPRLEEFVGERH